MEKQPKSTAIRKRTQIAIANKAMFLWVAGSSVLLGFALVAGIFLVQVSAYNEKVMAEKQNTINNLDSNLNTASGLASEIRKLDTNQLLAGLKAQSDDYAVQVVLDALPSDANSSALGASIQSKLLADIDGLTIQSLRVDPVLGIESTGGNGSSFSNSSSSSVSSYAVNFGFSVSGSETALKQVLIRLESSIRTIDIISLKIEGQSTVNSVMTVQARAFYEPERSVVLTDKVVK